MHGSRFQRFGKDSYYHKLNAEIDDRMMRIDLFELSRNREEAAGDLSIAAMSRVDTPERSGVLHWQARGAATPSGAAAFHLDVDGTITLICQRCLEPMAISIAIHSRFRIVADESAAMAIDATDDDYDAMVGSESFDLDALIEDEVILALPLAPRHAQCPGSVDTLPPTERKLSPFAMLASLKSNERKNGE